MRISHVELNGPRRWVGQVIFSVTLALKEEEAQAGAEGKVGCDLRKAHTGQGSRDRRLRQLPHRQRWADQSSLTLGGNVHGLAEAGKGLWLLPAPLELSFTSSILRT